MKKEVRSHLPTTSVVRATKAKKDYKASIPAILFSTLFISEILSFAN